MQEVSQAFPPTRSKTPEASTDSSRRCQAEARLTADATWAAAHTAVIYSKMGLESKIPTLTTKGSTVFPRTEFCRKAPCISSVNSCCACWLTLAP